MGISLQEKLLKVFSIRLNGFHLEFDIILTVNRVGI